MFHCEDTISNEYFCKGCKFSTNLKTHLNHHIKELHGLKKEHKEKFFFKIYTCQYCSFCTFSSIILLGHQTIDKRTHRGYITDEISDLVTFVIEDGIKWYFCPHCNLKSKQKVNLRRHIQYKHPPFNHIKHKDNEIKRDDLKERITVDYTVFRQIINQHSNVDITVHQCDECEYNTTKLRYLKQHQTNKHKGANLRTKINHFQCGFCKYKTHSRPLLKLHIQRKHTSFVDTKWLHCDRCQYKAKTFTDIRYHKLDKHTDEDKRFKCNHCEYVATVSTHLKRHIVNKHTEDQNINWFVCDQCDFKSKTKYGITSHHLTHSQTRFQCDQCDYKCKNKKYLKQHMLGHQIKPS